MFAIRMLQEGSEQGGIGGYVWVALVIFFLMVFLGWLASDRGWLKKEEEPVKLEHAHAEHETEHPQVEPAHETKADDLTQLEGIGPKVAGVLAGIGITSFQGLASADYTHVKDALDAAGYKYMDPAGWIEQAALAARGDREGLAKLQAALKGGRKAG